MLGRIKTATQLLSRPSTGLQAPQGRPLTVAEKQRLIFDLLRVFIRLASQNGARPISDLGVDFLSKLRQYGLTEADVEEAIASLQQTPTKQSLINALVKARVLPGSLPPAAAAQSVQTATPPPPAAAPVAQRTGLYQGDVLAELSQSDRSWLVTGATGTGKSTTARARAALQLATRSDTQYFYLDLQAESFIGLHSDPTVSTRLNGIGAEVITPFSNVVHRVYEIFHLRNQEDQQAVDNGTPKANHHPVILVINEFNGICSIGSEMTATEQKETGYAAAISRISAIITRGRSLNVSVWLIAQVHRKGDIDLAPGIVRNMDVWGLGIQRGPNGDYSPVKFLVEDRYLICKEDRDRLGAVLPGAIKASKDQKKVLALTTQGEPKLALLRPDVLELAEEDASGYYQHGQLSMSVNSGLYGGGFYG